MTLAPGLTQSFAQLLVARIGVGLGEAGAMPASHAMISDLYAPSERGLAMTIWSAEVNGGIFVAFLVRGLIGHRFGWRIAFIASGIATMMLALLVRLTVTEPARTPVHGEHELRAAPSRALTGMTARQSWNDTALRNITAGAVLTATVGYGSLAWIPSFLARTSFEHRAGRGLSRARCRHRGGAMASGKIFDIVHRRDARWGMAYVGLAYIAIKPLLLTFFLAGSTQAVLTAFVIPGLVSTLFIGPALAVLHNRMTASLRPTESAIFLMLINMIGLSLGPFLVGATSEWLFAGSGNHALAYALAVLQAFGVWGAAHFIVAARHMAQTAPTARVL